MDSSDEIRPFLSSCLALGSSLLERYNPSGDRRPARQTEAEFQRQVEQFFRRASCAGLDTEIFQVNNTALHGLGGKVTFFL